MAKKEEMTLKIRLLALDMDGTTLKNDHATISKRNLTAIQRAMNAGVIFVPATGRMRTHLPKAIEELPDWNYSLTSNGAAVVCRRDGEIIYSDFLNRELIGKLMEKIRNYPVFFELYCNGKSYIEKERIEHFEQYNIPIEDLPFFQKKCNVVEGLDNFIRQDFVEIEKIYIPYIRPEIHASLKQEIAAFNVAITSSVDTNIEVNSKTANKGNALKALCEHLNIASTEVMAIGDNHNDYEMLKFAGISVAMENADPNIKEIASCLTKSNEEDGVACAIERLIFGETQQ